MKLSGFLEQVFLVFGVLCCKVQRGFYVIHLHVRIIIGANYLLGRQPALQKFQHYVHRDPSPQKARLSMLDLWTHAYILLDQVIHWLLLKQSITPLIIKRNPRRGWLWVKF